MFNSSINKLDRHSYNPVATQLTPYFRGLMGDWGRNIITEKYVGLKQET